MFRWGFDPISRWLHNLVQWNLNVLHFLTWPGLLALVVVVAARVSGIRAAITAGVAVFVIGGLGLWEPAMITGRADRRVGRDRARARRPARHPQRPPPGVRAPHARAARRDAGDARVLLPAAVRAALRHRLSARGDRDGGLRAARRDPPHAARAARGSRASWSRSAPRTARRRASRCGRSSSRSRGPRCCSA